MYAFDQKHIGIMESMGMAENCLSESQATPERTLAMLEQVSSTADAFRQVMARRLIELREQALLPAKLAKILQK